MSTIYKLSKWPLGDTKDNSFIDINLPFSCTADMGWTLKSTCTSCYDELIWSWDERINNQVHQNRFVRLPSPFAKKWDEDCFFELSHQVPNSHIGEINKLRVILDDHDEGTFRLAMNRCISFNAIFLLKYRKGYPPEEREQSDKKHIVIEFKSIFFPDQNFISCLYKAVIKPLPLSWTE